MTLIRKKTIALATAGLMAVGIGGAFAYIKATGTGTGTAAAATVQAITLAGTASVPLTPDGLAHQLTITYANPNGFPVRAQNGITLALGTLPAACTAAEFHVADVVGPVGFLPNAASGTALMTHDGGTIMWDESASDQTGCLTALAGGGVPVTLTVA